MSKPFITVCHRRDYTSGLLSLARGIPSHPTLPKQILHGASKTSEPLNVAQGSLQSFLEHLKLPFMSRFDALDLAFQTHDSREIRVVSGFEAFLEDLKGSGYLWWDGEVSLLVYCAMRSRERSDWMCFLLLLLSIVGRIP